MDIELIPEDLITTLEGSVERLQVIFADNQGTPLNDDVTEVMQLCLTVEGVLRHMQKEKVSFWGERRDYWNYLGESVGEMKALDSIVKMVQAQPQFNTSQGRGRALIRECLREQLLADCVQNAVSNKKRTKEWYHASAILLSPTLSQRVLNALYDLSNVTFDLQSEGVDLDETWPSFVLKSFGGTQSQQRKVYTDTSSQKKTLFGVLGSSTIEASVANMNKPTKHPILERAVEEHATEIFVKHEVPFNLPLVGTLLADIRSELIGQCDEHMFPLQSALPELKVEKMDDITSCLTLLSEYIRSWSGGVVSFNNSLVEELRILKERLADLELQLQETLIESESSETSLLSQIQRSRSDLVSCSGQSHQLSAENDSLLKDNHELRKKVSELETLNFDLEEQLIRCGDEDGDKRRRAYTILEASVAEKDMEISQAAQSLTNRQGELDLLKTRLEQAQVELKSQAVTCETLQQSQESIQDLNTELVEARQNERELKCEIQKLESNKCELEASIKKLKSDTETEIINLKQKYDLELQDLNERLKLESDKCTQAVYECDQAKAELSSMHGLVENETASLRFQVSTQAIDLQRAKELSVKHEKVITEYKGRVANLESQLGETSERCEAAESQIEELKIELQDVEGVLYNNKEEMTSLNEQLAEKTLSRDLERSQTLKLNTEVEVLSTRLKAEKTELSRQVEKMTTENDDLRRAFKKLLQQKVTLWQHADKLEQEQVAKGKWINEKSVTECMGCSMTFSVFNRKHHCRSCGKVFCTNCCEKKAQLPFSKDPVRVCESCHDKIQDVRTPFASKMINTLDTESLMLSQAIGVSGGEAEESGDSEGVNHDGSSRNSLNISRNVEVNGNSLQAKLLLQNSDSLPSINDSTVSGNNSYFDSTLDMASRYLSALDQTSSSERLRGLDVESIHSVSSADYAVDPELKLREAEKLQQNSEDIEIPEGNVRISAMDGATEDDSYYVIESNPQSSVFPVGLDSPGAAKLDVDALASKLASLEVANEVEKSHTRRVSDGSTAGFLKAAEYKEVLMEGGGIHVVPMSIKKIGTAIVWEFSTEPKGIAFGIWYKEKRDSKKEDEVLPLKRCLSHKATLTGEYVSQKTGVYVLKFDNCHSKYTGRTLLYKVWTRSPL